jgi:hypothetical protein
VRYSLRQPRNTIINVHLLSEYTDELASRHAGRQHIWLSMRCCGPENGRICSSHEWWRTPLAADWLWRAVAGIRLVFSALAVGDWEPDVVAPKRAILVTQCASDRCRQTPATAGWLWRVVTGSWSVFSTLAWQCEPEWLVSANDSGAAGETPAAVTSLLNTGGHWRSIVPPPHLVLI